MTHQDLIHFINHIKEKLNMAITDDLTTLEASVTKIVNDDAAKTQQIADLTQQNSDLTAQVAANAQAATDLANAEAQIQALTAQINAQVP